MILAALVAAAITYKGNFIQGGLVQMSAPVGSVVYLDNRQIDGFNGKYFIAIDRDAPKVETLNVTLPNGQSGSYQMSITQRDFGGGQQITQVDEAITNPTTVNKDRMDEEMLELASAQIQADAPCNPNFAFMFPANGRITAPFGVVRTYNGKKGSPHGGVDFAGNVGDPFVAPEGGKIIFLDDLMLSGKTMVLDHGCGITSTFMHLDHSDRRVGDLVKKGEAIGFIGRTGLVTGPHLHWGVEIGQTRLDPMLLVK